MIALNILLGLAAFVCFLFTIGETKPPMSKERRRAALAAFVVVVILIIALNFNK